MQCAMIIQAKPQIGPQRTTRKMYVVLCFSPMCNIKILGMNVYKITCNLKKRDVPVKISQNETIHPDENSG